jgi:hypothetical protein
MSPASPNSSRTDIVPIARRRLLQKLDRGVGSLCSSDARANERQVILMARRPESIYGIGGSSQVVGVGNGWVTREWRR